MKLKLDTVSKAIDEFCEIYGAPWIARDRDLEGEELGEFMIKLCKFYHKNLSAWHTEETFKDAVLIAGNQSRGFPTVADFYADHKPPVDQRKKVCSDKKESGDILVRYIETLCANGQPLKEVMTPEQFDKYIVNGRKYRDIGSYEDYVNNKAGTV
jgi:hypothetical protein